MADEVLKIDKNHRNVLGGVTDDANLFLTNLRVDPSSLRLKVDAAITSGGSGGTQYVTAAAQATPTGTVALGWDGANVQALKTTSGGNLILGASTNIVGKVTIDQTTPGTTNAVAIQDGAGNALTSNSVTYTAKKALDGNLLGTLGTAFSTAGKVDVKGADGDVFVRNATAANFLANVTLQTQTDTIMVGGVNIKEINAVTPLMGNGATGTGSQRVTLANDNTGIATWGHGATGSAVPSGAQYHGAQARSSEITAATNANLVGLVADLVGKLIVLPYANPENFVNGTTAAIVDTTSTSTIAAQGVGVRTYITQITVTNSHATVGTFVKILDGASIIFEAYAAAAGGGFTATFPTPLKGTANTAVNTQPVTTGANVIASISGYKGV